MRFFIIVFTLVVILFSACNSGTATRYTVPPARSIFPPDFDYASLEGVYTGAFGDYVIYLNLRKVTGKNVMGYSVLKGVRRNVGGPMEVLDDVFHLSLKQPGNNPADGYFDIKIDKATLLLSGTWTPRNTAKDSPVTFSLIKKAESEDYIDDYASYSDGRHTITFESNGQCNYSFYNDSLDGDKNQMTSVNGSWVLKEGSYIIDWTENNVFSTPRSIFPRDSVKTDTANDYFTPSLHCNDRILTLDQY
jgi:hypothetical protein